VTDARTAGFGANGLAPPGRLASARVVPKQAALAGPRRRFVVWLALAGLVIPAWEGHVSIAGAKFTVGRLAVTVLVIPGLILLARRGRRLMTSDVAGVLMAGWMLVAAAITGGVSSLSSPAAESLQFLFAYIVGRAFFSGPAALDTFIRTLKALTFFMILVAVAEHITGRWVAHDITAAVFGTKPLTPVFRDGFIRATSTLDHPILFGVFSALVNAILLLWEKNGSRRVMLSLVCLLGCILSQSSASLMAYVLGVAAYAYDRQLRTVSARWTIFWVLFGVAAGLIFLVTKHPIGWVISHLTLDPQSGYYRILIWDAALGAIAQSQLIGYSFQLFSQHILDNTIDSVWLVEALRYGVPAVAFLFWANIAAIWPARRRQTAAEDDFDRRMNFAFTIVLLLFVFSGITVHIWNYMWIFWGMCIGIKTSLRERAISA